MNINAFINALKLTWLRKLIIYNNSQWSLLLQYNVNMYSKYFNFGTAYTSEKILPKIKTSFG